MSRQRRCQLAGGGGTGQLQESEVFFDRIAREIPGFVESGINGPSMNFHVENRKFNPTYGVVGRVGLLFGWLGEWSRHWWLDLFIYLFIFSHFPLQFIFLGL